MGKMKELSVIIVTYNSEPDIYGCLEALFAHNDLGDSLEVIVVDNNSRDFEHLQTELHRLYGESIILLRNTRLRARKQHRYPACLFACDHDHEPRCPSGTFLFESDYRVLPERPSFGNLRFPSDHQFGQQTRYVVLLAEPL